MAKHLIPTAINAAGGLEEIRDDLAAIARRALSGTAASIDAESGDLILVTLRVRTSDLDDDGNCDESTAVFRALEDAGLDVRDDATSGPVYDDLYGTPDAQYEHRFAVYGYRDGTQAEQIIEFLRAVRAAMDNFGGWNWTMEFAGRQFDGPPDADDTSDEAEDAREYNARVEAAVARCREIGEAVIEAVHADEWETVEGLIEDACRQEGQFGCDNEWGVASERLERINEQREQAD